MTPEFAQQILDRFHVGGIISMESGKDTCLVTTAQGQYLIGLCGDDLFEARELLPSVIAGATSRAQKATLLVLADYSGKLAHESSLVHKRGMYYCVVALSER